MLLRIDILKVARWTAYKNKTRPAYWAIAEVHILCQNIGPEPEMSMKLLEF
jgi:hypothetical protein